MPGVRMLGAWNDARMNTKGIFRFVLAAAILWQLAAPPVRAQEAQQGAQEAPPTAPLPLPPAMTWR